MLRCLFEIWSVGGKCVGIPAAPFRRKPDDDNLVPVKVIRTILPGSKDLCVVVPENQTPELCLENKKAGESLGQPGEPTLDDGCLMITIIQARVRACMKRLLKPVNEIMSFVDEV